MSRKFEICLILSLFLHILVVNYRADLLTGDPWERNEVRITEEDLFDTYVLKLPRRESHEKAVGGETRIESAPIGKVDKIGARETIPFDDLIETYRTMLLDSLFFPMIPPSIVGGKDALRRRLRYPAEMLGFGIRDTVVIEVHVSWRGKMDRYRIRKVPRFKVFQHIVVSALKRTRFNPALVNGAPAVRGCWVRIPITFAEK